MSGLLSPYKGQLLLTPKGVLKMTIASLLQAATKSGCLFLPYLFCSPVNGSANSLSEI